MEDGMVECRDSKHLEIIWTFGNQQKSPKPTTKEPYIAAQEPFVPAKEPNHHRGIPVPYLTHSCVTRMCVNGTWIGVDSLMCDAYLCVCVNGT